MAYVKSSLIPQDILDIPTISETVRGNPCSFTTDINMPLVSLSASIVATQASGTPTPSNPLPISGISSLEIVRCGVNLLDSTKIVPFNANCTVTKTDNLITVVNNNGYAVNFFTGVDVLLGAGTYRISIKENTTLQIGIYKKVGGSYQYLADGITVGSRTATFTLTQTEIIRPQCNVDANSTYSLDEIQITQGATELPFEDYNGQTFTIDLGGTRYGGVYTADGKLRITFIIVDFGDLNWTYSTTGYFYATPYPDSIKPNIDNNTTPDMLCSVAQADTPNHVYAGSSDNIITCTTATPSSIWIRDNSYTDAATFKTAMTGQKIVYELATPIEIDVSSISVVAVSGVNNISSNGGGNIEQLTYFESVGMKIQKGV